MPDAPGKVAPDDVGCFPGTPYCEYDALLGTSQGRLWTLYEKTPAHFRCEEDHPQAVETDAMREGRAVHAAILEPKRFEADFTDESPINKKTGAPFGTRTKTYEAWASKVRAAGQEPLANPKVYYREIGAAVLAHPYAGPLLDQMQKEVSFQWRDGETGLLLKGRADALRMLWQPRILVEIKSCASAAPRQFGYDAYRYGYLWQLAYYADGILAATGQPVEEVQIIAVEKELPYGVAVYRVDPYQLALGRDQVRDTLRQLAQCLRYGDWPGYPEGVEDLQIPAWAGNEWTPFTEGLETVLVARAKRMNRTIPDASKPEQESLGL